MTSTASTTASLAAPLAASATASIPAPSTASAKVSATAARPARRGASGSAGCGPRPAAIQAPIQLPTQWPVQPPIAAPVPGAGPAQQWLLPPGAVRRLPEPPPGGPRPLLQVCSGRIWLTQAGDADDHFLAPGHAPWPLGTGCVIESDGAETARVRLLPASPG